MKFGKYLRPFLKGCLWGSAGFAWLNLGYSLLSMPDTEEYVPRNEYYVREFYSDLKGPDGLEYKLFEEELSQDNLSKE